jgi:hypothetical protein
MQFLVESGLYKSKEESARQEEVLGELDKVVIFSSCQILSFSLLVLPFDLGT